jgi:hypothetical protein
MLPQCRTHRLAASGHSERPAGIRRQEHNVTVGNTVPCRAAYRCIVMDVIVYRPGGKVGRLL